MSYSIEQFQKDIEEVITVCHEEIEAIKLGEQREATVRQIEQFIIPEMEKLLHFISIGTIPEPGDRYLMTVQAILKSWSWDINKDEQLVNLLGCLDTNYQRSTF
ncbi:MAG: hypothetical protein FWH40_09725 [Coriobacteriia bacterium]|nr:hypothetical protein [Coriobacteriia bacterium]